MSYITHYLEMICHLDIYIASIINYFGNWTYVILFLIIFCESAIIITPFLPGESLLFALGTLAARGVFDIYLLTIVLITAAIVGGLINYFFGFMVGEKIKSKLKNKLLQQYLQRTHVFYERHGGKTIFIARFLPIIRTYAPFVAGIARMNFMHFFIYNLIGGLVWITSFIIISFYFGNIPFIKNNFAYVILFIILISLLPALIEFLRYYVTPQKEEKNGNA